MAKRVELREGTEFVFGAPAKIKYPHPTVEMTWDGNHYQAPGGRAVLNSEAMLFVGGPWDGDIHDPTLVNGTLKRSWTMG